MRARDILATLGAVGGMGWGCGAATPPAGGPPAGGAATSASASATAASPRPPPADTSPGRVACTAERTDPESGDFTFTVEIEGRRVIAASFHSNGDWGTAEGTLPAPVEVAAEGFTRLKLAVTYRLAQEPDEPREDERELAFLVDGDSLRLDDGTAGRCTGRAAPGASAAAGPGSSAIPPLVGSGGTPPPPPPPPPPSTLLVLRGSENDVEIQLATVEGPLGRHFVKAEARVEVPVPPGRLSWTHLDSNCTPSGILEIQAGATLELACWHSARSGDCCGLGGPAGSGGKGEPTRTPADDVADFLRAWNAALDARSASFFTAHARLPLAWSARGEAGTTSRRFTKPAQLAAAGGAATIDPGFVDAVTIDPARALARHGICPAETGIPAGARPAITVEGAKAQVAWLGGRCGQFVHLVVLELERAEKSWRVVGQRVE